MAILIIKNTAHDGYRRAGVALARGENRLTLESFTQDQITQLENDPHLLVAIEADEGELVAAEVLAANTVATQTDILNGSDTLPPVIEIGADQVPLGEIVRIAFDQSELSSDDWNALEAADRDARLQVVIDAACESAAAKAAAVPAAAGKGHGPRKTK